MSKEKKEKSVLEIEAENNAIMKEIGEIQAKAEKAVAELKRGFIVVEHKQAGLQHCNDLAKKNNLAGDKPKA